MKPNRRVAFAFAAAAGLSLSAAAHALDVTVTFENLAPANGTWVTPLWIGFHDGTFDTFDLGSPASAELERLAEDGNTGPISAAFTGPVDGTIASAAPPPLSPGETASMTFTIDTANPDQRYFSFLSMVIPSNDAFIGNSDPMAIPIADGEGNFIGADLIILGSQVYDAGAEVNDEIPANTALLGQMAPDTGVNEAGVVAMHPGFLAPGNGGILDEADFAAADFTASAYQVARITVTPEPTTLALLGLGAMAALRRRRRTDLAG